MPACHRAHFAVTQFAVAQIVVLFFTALLLVPCAPVRAADAPAAAFEMVVSLLDDADADRRAIGIDAVRHAVPGAAATRALTARLPKLPAPTQAALLGALAERGDPAALPAVKAILAAATDADVRAAAVRALGALGGPDEVPSLVASLSRGGAEQAAAIRALQVIRGAEAAAALRQAAGTAAPPARAAVIRILADRRDRDARSAFTAAAAADDAAVRRAALESLARLGGPAEIAGVVSSLLRFPDAADREAAVRTIVQICTTNPDHEQASRAFLDAFRAASAADREILLPALGRVGGPGALEIVDGLVADPDADRRRLGIRALSLWPDATVSGRLLDLLQAASDDAERDVLVDGLIRIAPRPDNGLDDAGRLDLLRQTMELCRRDEDRARVLQRANAIRTIEAFRFVVAYLDDPRLADPACLSVVELAHHQKLREDHKPEFTAALDKVIATARNPEHVERAEAYKQGKTWQRRKG